MASAVSAPMTARGSAADRLGQLRLGQRQPDPGAAERVQRAVGVRRAQGGPHAGGSGPPPGRRYLALPAQPQNVVAVAGNERAMAALQADGTVIGWGRAGSGASFAGPVGIGSADATSPVAPLGKVAKLWPTKRGFVALNSDGSASSWGNIETTFDGNGGSKSISSYSTPRAWPRLRMSPASATIWARWRC